MKLIQRIVCGDNLEVLKTFKDESVDLVYIDPPFFTNKNYEIIWGDGAEMRQFHDRWITEHENGTGRASKDINVYLEWMEPRIRELHRALKKTGTFYLHCDMSASGYLRVICDKIFGYDGFRNEIIWFYPDSPGRPRKDFPRKHDNILRYTKSDEYTFNDKDIRVEILDESKERYKSVRVLGGKKYLGGESAEIGKIPEDVWRIPVVKGNSRERLGYPTQKPEALLERIIKASSNEGDIVLDAFAGCGTTIAVASRLNRQYIGIDVSPTACRLIANRVGIEVKSVEGMPLNAEEIAKLSGWEFQNYVIRLLSPTVEGITVNNKGADGGIDGWYYKLLISVKKYQAGRKDLDEFVATMYRNKTKVGMFLALGYSVPFVKEVARLKREQGLTVRAFTLEQILNHEHEPFVLEYNPSLEKFFNRGKGGE